MRGGNDLKATMRVCFTILLLISMTLIVSAHSGRTDGQGGHKDNQNKSGLGSYHYHHGYGPHLHPNGVCPYSSNVTTSSSSSSSNTSSSSAVDSTKPKNISVESVDITSNSSFMTIGDEVSLFVSFSPSNASNRDLKWETSDNNIIALSSNTLSAVSIGEAEISVYSNNLKSDHVHIMVYPSIDMLRIEDIEDGIYVNEPYQLKLANIPDDLPEEFSTWSSNDNQVIEVDENGLLIPKSSGVTTINCKLKSGLSTKVEVEVYNRINEINILEKNIVIEEGLKIIMPLKIVPFDSNSKDIQWKVTNPNVATINEDLVIEAIGVGKTSIYAIVNGIARDSIIVEVEKTEVVKKAEEVVIDSINELTENKSPIDESPWDVLLFTIGTAVSLGTVGTLGFLIGRKSK